MIYHNTEPKPIFAIHLNGKDITGRLDDRLESLTITDNRGGEADQLDIVLQDHDGLLEIPPRGAELSISIGWEETGLINKGSYKIDEVEHSGSPDKLTLRGRSAEMNGSLNLKRERSFHGKVLGDIVATIAKQNKLKSKISPSLAKKNVAHIDQTNESDMNLLTRLGDQFDAIVTVKEGHLLFMPTGHGETVSGKPMPAITITRSSGDSHRISIADRENYTAVKANYQNTKGAKQGAVTYDKNGKTEKAPEGNIKILRHTYASKATAERAARSNWAKLQRGVAEFSINLARGRPDLMPEMPARVSGFKPMVDDAEWIISKVTHTLSETGLGTSLELEVRLEKLADDDEE
ncbi:phage late control D family protein [Iodobacter sp.]|uniref:phage late control D family protein n=1 Tax=Iodobacter sp. TaxID=1915058 RepID=UPI0025DA9C61|nr:phage late control D family protein [Iodobacter sp.]